ncbi:MAG: HlyD family efflux transporter periplasmic adaptor subunit [Phycisphaerae bacterium]|nr:HlyD family efflux transporter periplasmic adaptor subunit [Phycisphaerae bacterium]
MAQSYTWQDRGLWRWRRHAAPVAVWLLAVAVIGGLLAHRSSNGELQGIADARPRAVSAGTDGRLRLVPITLFEPVEEGQTLAVLEDDRIQALLATAAAEAARLRAELTATEDRLAVEAAAQEADRMARTRQYALDVESNRLREIELQVTLQTDRVRLEYLRLQKDLLNRLREERAVSELRFQSAHAEHQALETGIAENEKALAQVRQDLDEARRRQDAFARHQAEPPAIAKALEPLRAAVSVQERRIAELAVEQTLLVIRSPVDGVVSQILRGAGESVRIGEPILMVAAAQPSAVIAYANAAQRDRFEAGLPVRLAVVRNGIVELSADSQVLAVGPAAEEIPARLWRSPTAPEWGWPILIAVPPSLEIACGEVIGVSRP